jgi:hypothetical protein
MKYGKSDKGYFIMVAKVDNGEGKMGHKMGGHMSEKEGEDMDESKSTDPLSKFVPPYRGVSFEEAGFKIGSVAGKETWIPTGEAAEKFTDEETSNKLAFQVVGTDKYNPVIVDISSKIVKSDKVKEMAGIPGKDLSEQLHACLICEYKPGAEECCCALMSLVKPDKEEEYES